MLSWRGQHPSSVFLEHWALNDHDQSQFETKPHFPTLTSRSNRDITMHLSLFKGYLLVWWVLTGNHSKRPHISWDPTYKPRHHPYSNISTKTTPLTPPEARGYPSPPASPPAAPAPAPASASPRPGRPTPPGRVATCFPAAQIDPFVCSFFGEESKGPGGFCRAQPEVVFLFGSRKKGVGVEILGTLNKTSGIGRLKTNPSSNKGPNGKVVAIGKLKLIFVTSLSGVGST